MMDFATRYPEAIPLRKDAVTVAEALMETFTRLGVPQEILSDKGTNFLAATTQASQHQHALYYKNLHYKNLHYNNVKKSPHWWYGSAPVGGQRRWFSAS